MIVWGGANNVGTHNDGATFCADEDYLPQPSVCGLGVCRAFGSLDCMSGTIVNSCVPGTPNASVDDSCNTVDDDCDGGVDEDFPAYNERWADLAPAPSARTNHTAVTSGPELLVFGGDNGAGVVQTGGLAYDFLADTWRTLPAGPAKRWNHTAVFADSRMIVWGGDDNVATIHNTGSRYPGTTAYDMVKGSLTTLRATGGDFTNSACMQNDNPMTQGWDVVVPAPGDGTWYLVRPVNACSGNGTFDGPSPPQQGGRDAELAGSASACP